MVPCRTPSPRLNSYWKPWEVRSCCSAASRPATIIETSRVIPLCQLHLQALQAWICKLGSEQVKGGQGRCVKERKHYCGLMQGQTSGHNVSGEPAIFCSSNKLQAIFQVRWEDAAWEIEILPFKASCCFSGVGGITSVSLN